MENKAYVYSHSKENGEVFYIGIGIKKKFARAYEKFSRTVFWENIIKKNPNYIITILFKNLTWKEACIKEIELIKFYGRRDKGLGTLCNMTDGGDGQVGWIPSQETKDNIRKANTGKRIGENNSFYGKKHSEEVLKIMSETHKGIKRSEESKLKQSNTIKASGWKPSEFIMKRMCDVHGRRIVQLTLDGDFVNEFYIITDAQRYNEKFLPPKINCCCKGTRKSHAGFRWMYLEDFQKLLSENKKPQYERSKNEKLTKEQVLEIRKLYSNGNTIEELFSIFSVGKTTIYNIVNRISWKKL